MSTLCDIAAGSTPIDTDVSIEKTYTMKTQLEHIILRPDTYIGSVEKEKHLTWVYCDRTERMVRRELAFVPGLYKIVDEILVNAADNKQRDASMNKLAITVDLVKGTISVFNNGAGVPVTMHADHGCYVPELIFGNLLTSSNYNDAQAKTTGGRNGFGAKLANIFSTSFTLETVDSSRSLKYVQTWTDNMQAKQAPTIKPCTSAEIKKGDYTRITFTPDLEKFNMTRLDDDIVSLIRTRAYDMAGTTDKSLRVFYNGKRIALNSFKEYIQLYNPKTDTNGTDVPKFVTAKFGDRWEVGVGITDGHFQQVSFVNTINTMKGGSHVKMITDQLTGALLKVIGKKHKALKLKDYHVRNHMFVFVNALIVNPVFDSQTKVNLTCNKKKFGSTCDVTDDVKFMRAVGKTGIVDSVLSMAQYKERKSLGKNDGTKKTKLKGIDKLDDANDAGGRNSADCTLILTEGDSAKALAVSGLGVIGRDKYGVFPLKGKLLNVRDASTAIILKNTEITNLKAILGLKQGVEYTDTKALRYGHVMIMTDQDHDGSHIKGLVINMFAVFWPSLLKLPGFITEFITPIVRCSKGKRAVSFYTMPEYEVWKGDHADGKGWKVKYYKGLGTSTSAEAKVYFKDLVRHKIDFAHIDSRCDDAIDLAFNKKRADDRKAWMLAQSANVYLDQDVNVVSYKDFVNKELILFSMASNVRAIPSMVDGLKPGQRKIVFACLKKMLNDEIKVAQLAGYVSEQAAYHHGELSLTSTIVGMAQDYVGSNNINLLFPAGQFGTRLSGGKDAASARYIFTRLAPISFSLFRSADTPLLKGQVEEGQSIEPLYYMPIIPLVLVNGSAGIGTGWSSSIPNYNPKDIVAQLHRLLRGEQVEPIHPWYAGHTGQMITRGKHAYISTGRIQQTSPTTFVISDLPIGVWTSTYKSFLEECVTNETIVDVREYHTDTTVSFELTLTPAKMASAWSHRGGPMDKFKLKSAILTSNMTLFDAEGNIRTYNSPSEIIADFYTLRLDGYERRKALEEKGAVQQMRLLNTRARFIQAVVDGALVLSNRAKCDIVAELRILDFSPYRSFAFGEEEEEEEEEGTVDGSSENALDFDYLLNMPLLSLTLEKVRRIKKECAEKAAGLELLRATSAKHMWKNELDAFIVELDAQEEARAVAATSDAALCSKGIADDFDEFGGDDEKDKDMGKKRRKSKGKVVLLTPVVAEGFTPIDVVYTLSAPIVTVPKATCEKKRKASSQKLDLVDVAKKSKTSEQSPVVSSVHDVVSAISVDDTTTLPVAEEPHVAEPSAVKSSVAISESAPMNVEC